MNFVSPIFWIALVPIYLIWRIGFSNKGKTEARFLLGASLFLYSIYFPFHLFNIVIVTVITFKLTQKEKASHTFLAVGINCLHLFFYKYHEIFFPASRLFSSPQFDLIIPIGISFYTFQNLSYIFDLHRKKASPYQNCYDYLLYISFFPQLVAGPIVRSGFFLSQWKNRRKIGKAHLLGGLERIIHGLFLKLVVADNLAEFVNNNWEKAYLIENGAELPLCLIIAFGCQIFGDFAGYSLIALGIALLFGIVLPRNFRSPYIASSLSEFWQRWHRTLSRWIRDYLYIPLGGGRQTKARIAIVLVIVMTASGLWHGNTMSFGLWGALHGIALALDRFTLRKAARKTENELARRCISLSRALFCFGTVMILWIFFREQSTFLALHFMRSLFMGDFSLVNLQALVIGNPLATYACAIVVFTHAMAYARQRKSLPYFKPMDRILICLFCSMNCLFVYGSSSTFIYFRF